MITEIVRDGATGQAIVAATGTPVDTILEALQSGDSHDDILRAHPGLTPQDIVAALLFARGAVQRGVRYPTAGEAARGASTMVREPVAAYGPSRYSASPTYADVQGALESAGRERERLAYKLDLIESIHDGLAQAAAGDVVPHEELFARLHGRFPG